MKVLVFGKAGQVASELQRYKNVITLDRNDADLTKPEMCAAAIAKHDVDVVINAAAYTAVDNAESDQTTALLVNSASPAAMAHAAAIKNIPFVHISTDYVFEGSGDAFHKVSAPTNPINAYGQTKLSGERAIEASGGTYCILRTSWVFSAHGSNFVKTMLRLAKTHDALSVVNDQVGGPTAAADIAAACMTIAEQLIDDKTKTGVYHFASTPAVSWAQFAEEIFKQASEKVSVTGILTKDYPTPAARPRNSRLDCSSLSTFGIQQPDWRISLTDVINKIEKDVL